MREAAEGRWSVRQLVGMLGRTLQHHPGLGAEEHTALL